ncbi:MAG: Ldh family oxidoreductase, partial [Pseudomonadota bacterium]
MIRFAVDELSLFLNSVLDHTGAPYEKCRAVAKVLLEGELLGYRTHGLVRLSYNYELLKANAATDQDTPLLLDEGPVFVADGSSQAGPWVLSNVVRHCADQAQTNGVCVGVIRRSGHIACAAAYMIELVERGLVGLILASTPSERVVSSPDGYKPITSNTPIAFCAPGENSPLLFDFTTAASTIGKITSASDQGHRLAEACLRTPDGELTDDPSAFFADPAATILPFGGEQGRHKGFALSLMIEALTFGLMGCSSAEAAQDGENNSVFLLVVDPEKFAGQAAMMR